MGTINIVDVAPATTVTGADSALGVQGGVAKLLPLNKAPVSTVQQAAIDAVNQIAAAAQAALAVNASAISALNGTVAAQAAQIAVLQAAILPGGATPPTITTDPTVSFPGGTGDPNETFTITPGTVGGGANTGVTYQVVIDGVPQGAAFPGVTGTLNPAWFTGSRLLRVVQVVSWSNGADITRTSTTYTLNALQAVPALVPGSPPYITGTPGGTLTGNHGSYTNSPTGWGSQWFVGNPALVTPTAISGQTASTINSASYPGQVLCYGELPSNATGTALAWSYSAAVTIPGTPASATLAVDYTASDSTANVVVSTEGSSDWQLFWDGTNTVSKSGGALTGGLVLSGASFSQDTVSISRTKSWTGGTPTSSGSASTGAKLEFANAAHIATIPAGATTSKAYKFRFWSIDTVRISAAWSDGSASVASFDFAANQHNTVTFTGGPANGSANLIVNFQKLTSNAGLAHECVTVYAASGGGGGGGGGTLPSPDTAWHADIPFANYSDTATYYDAVQLCGVQVTLKSVSEVGGFTYPSNGNVLGSPMRFGKVPDPITPSRGNAFRQAWKTGDPFTAGSVIRCDGRPDAVATQGVTYWMAEELLIPSNTYFSLNNLTFLNIHPGSSGSIATFQLSSNRYAGGSGMTYIRATQGGYPLVYAAIAQNDAPPDTWLQIVYQFRLSAGSDGFCKVWINGTQVVDDTGANTGAGSGDYVKLAFYLVSPQDASRPELEVFRRSFIRPQVSAAQTAASMRALLV